MVTRIQLSFILFFFLNLFFLLHQWLILTHHMTKITIFEYGSMPSSFFGSIYSQVKCIKESEIIEIDTHKSS